MPIIILGVDDRHESSRQDHAGSSALVGRSVPVWAVATKRHTPAAGSP